jgi:hypothetical protein
LKKLEEKKIGKSGMSKDELKMMSLMGDISKDRIYETKEELDKALEPLISYEKI